MTAGLHVCCLSGAIATALPSFIFHCSVWIPLLAEELAHVNLTGSHTRTHPDASAALEAGRQTAKNKKACTPPRRPPAPSTPTVSEQQCGSVPVTTHEMQSHAQGDALFHISMALPFAVIVYP